MSRKNINFIRIKNLKFYPNKELVTVSLLISTVILFILVIGTTYVDGFAKKFIYDSMIYFQMSYDPFQGTLAPYMYRIFTPFLVNLLPLNHFTGFMLINLTGFFLTALVLYYYLKKLNFKPIYGMVGVLFFLLSPTVIYSMYDIALVDSLSFFFFLLAFYAIWCKNDKIYFISLVLGILNKETILFTVPLYFLCKLDDEKLIKALKSTILVSISPLFLFIVIRYYFGFTSYFSFDTIQSTLLTVSQSHSVLIFPYFAFGTLWIISLYCIKFIDNTFLKKSLYLLPFIFMQILIATDMFRALFIAFPIIIPISLYLFKIKNKLVIFTFLILSLFIMITYFLFIPLNAYFVLLVFPLEILIFGVLLIQYLSIVYSVRV